MPLLDHFNPPLYPQHHWESFYANWATRIADSLSSIVPAEYMVEEYVHLGPSEELDIATFERPLADRSSTDTDGTGIFAAPYAPPRPTQSVPSVFADTFEVLVFRTRAGKTLVAAIEFVSPGNKALPVARTAFAAKCAGYLVRGISLILVDIVTLRRANLHNEAMVMLEASPDVVMPHEVQL